ncbi:MAG TPA: CRISPR-associated protein Csx11 [Anaerolineae bacterium]|nr:CRISPR-associated protein Csx11 [Anaerolineae bacterium]
MSHNLKVLADHREALLLAEVAAWLHDMGKCADAFLQPDGIGFNATGCRGNPRVNPHKAVLNPPELEKLPYWSQLSSDRGQCARLEESNHATALWRTFQSLGVNLQSLDGIRLPIGNIDFRELVLWGRPLVSDRYQNFNRVLAQRTHLAAVLGWAHKIAHMEKEDKADGGIAGYIDSPFGFKLPNSDLRNLSDKLKRVLEKLSGPRVRFLESLRTNFAKAPGDTRLPINEVTLWDWSSIVAALYKAELARCLLLNEQCSPRDVQWRLLSIRTDGLSYLLGAHGIPDLLARRDLLQDALKRAQILLEETYPLGLEVYRDENGSLFVVPDVDAIETSLVDSNVQKSLRQLILETFDKGTINDHQRLRLHGEIVPDIHADQEPWNGQPPKDLPPIKDHLQRKVELASNPAVMADVWHSRQEQICTVCGLRPQGPRQKAKERGVCDVCEERRADRSKEWATGELDTTIWTDEVADDNGRLALVVGQFALKHWLDGSLVRTLAVRDPASEPTRTAEAIAKNPSFARIRRVWETTRTFWQEIKEQIQDGTLIPLKGHRLAITSADAEALDLGPFHVYELVVKGIRLSVVWDKAKGRFVAADNLDYLASPEQLDQPVGDVVQPGRQFRLEEPTGYGGANRNLGAITMDAVERIEQPYPPVIPILAEPRTFMALVPASKALAVAEAIKAKYERETGKVRNRLPLHLGIVYAHRRTPLRAILDAGRRMLRRPSQIVQAEVVDISPVDPWPAAVDVTLRLDEREITVAVPTVMGDGTTHDVWYPYWQMADKPTDRTRWFIGPDGEHWVHVTDLRQGDRVQFTPSTFDFEYLDTSARRFEVAYNDNGQRRGADRRQRPYLLDEVDMLQNIWRTLQKHTTNAQIHALVELVEAKREEWHPLLDDETFHRFCRDVLANIEWRESPWGADRNSWLDTWLDYAVRGWIADTVELHHHVMRQR